MKQVRVGDVIHLIRKPVAIQPDREFVSIGVRGFGRGIFHYAPKSGTQMGSLRFFEVPSAALVISNIKAWEGAVALSSAADTAAIASNRFLIYTGDPEVVSMSFLRYLFLSDVGLPLIQRASPGSADRNRTLALERFEALEIPLPDIAEQCRIADRLDTISSIVNNHSRPGGRLQARRAALWPSICGRPDLDDRTRIARGWRRAALADVMSLANDVIAVEATGSYPNVGIFSFGRGVFAKPPIAGSATSAKTLNRIRAGQFIYSRLFAFEGAYASVPAAYDGCYVSGEFPTFNVDPAVAVPEYLAGALRNPSTWADLAAGSKGLGLRRQRIQADTLLRHVIWMPPVEEQVRVAALLKDVERLEQLAEQSRQLRGAILPAALNRAFAGMG